MATLLDQWMPAYDLATHYELTVAAPPARVWQAILELHAGDLAVVRWLFALRRLSLRRVPKRPLLESMTREGFLLLQTGENQEVVVGVAGRFWTFSSGIVRLASPALWRDYGEEGSARSAMNFLLEAPAPDRTRVSTETRIQTFGSRARRRFRLYWMVVGPFSGLIRRAFLREIRRRAELQVSPPMPKSDPALHCFV